MKVKTISKTDREALQAVLDAAREGREQCLAVAFGLTGVEPGSFEGIYLRNVIAGIEPLAVVDELLDALKIAPAADPVVRP